MTTKKSTLVKAGKELDGYNELLHDVRNILERATYRAYKAVDNLRVQTYWQIGERVVREEINQKRAGYGEEVVNRLSVDLKINERTLYRVLRFYKTYPILTTVLSELTWSHYIVLTDIKNNDQRRFYETLSVKESWSVRELKNRINGKEYEKASKKGEITITLPAQLPSPEDVFKESYDWGFISLEEQHTEKELEDALLDNVQNVLLEFGHGFAFMGRQQKILISNNWHKIDMLFYHILLKCHVLVELKARALMHGDIEQVTKYLTYFREKKVEGDRDPVALIICKSHDRIDAYYSAGKDKDDIFVAEYKTKLPSEKEIEKKLKVHGAVKCGGA
ncbi:MAG: hypothetical protein MSIBF_01685 [Candidatus Altiarchaeales archaeon IMC4]|nr:MAG: hypothetical protein MSIBF_01685 [Candidatus Altiarchaeales archaeon IMC4]